MQAERALKQRGQDRAQRNCSQHQREEDPEDSGHHLAGDGALQGRDRQHIHHQGAATPDHLQQEAQLWGVHEDQHEGGYAVHRHAQGYHGSQARHGGQLVHHQGGQDAAHPERSQQVAVAGGAHAQLEFADVDK